MAYSTEVLTDSPVVYLRLGESTGSVANDTSGNSHNGTYNGTYTIGSTGLISDGTGDTALRLDGGGWVTSGGFGAFDNAASLELWVNLDSVAPRQVIAAVVPASQIALYVESGTLYCRMHQQGVSLSTSITTGRHHIVIAADRFGGAQGIKLFVDGSVASTITPTANRVVSLGTATVLVGKSDGNVEDQAGVTIPSGSFVTGVVDEVAFYAFKLGDARVAAHYSAGSSGGGATTVTVGLSSGNEATFVVAVAPGISGTDIVIGISGSQEATFPLSITEGTPPVSITVGLTTGSETVFSVDVTPTPNSLNVGLTPSSESTSPVSITVGIIGPATIVIPFTSGVESFNLVSITVTSRGIVVTKTNGNETSFPVIVTISASNIIVGTTSSSENNYPISLLTPKRIVVGATGSGEEVFSLKIRVSVRIVVGGTLSAETSYPLSVTFPGNIQVSFKTGVESTFLISIIISSEPIIPKASYYELRFKLTTDQDTMTLSGVPVMPSALRVIARSNSLPTLNYMKNSKYSDWKGYMEIVPIESTIIK